MNLSQNFSQKNNLLSPFQKNNFSRDCSLMFITYPKSCEKETPFMDLFAQLSYMSAAIQLDGWDFPNYELPFEGRFFFLNGVFNYLHVIHPL